MGKFEPPNDDPTAGDAAHKLTRTALSVIPVAGGPAIELFEAVVQPPLLRRQQEWRVRIGEAMEELENRLDGLEENLSENDAFLDATLQASQIAIRTSDEEKLEALKNAIVNSALPDSPNKAKQQMFLQYIDTFTVWHLLLLQLFDDPPAWAERQEQPFRNRTSGSISHILEEAFPSLRGQRAFYDQVWRDLHVRGLLNTDSPHGMMTAAGMLAKRTTDLGSEFVHFIENKSDT